MKEQIDLSGTAVENSEPPEVVEAPAEIETSETITYRHASGLEVSGTIEEMRNGCPVLAKMAVEECVELIEKQDIATMLAERGKARRMAAEKFAKEETAEVEEKPVVAPIVTLEAAVQTQLQSETTGYVPVIDKPVSQVKPPEESALNITKDPVSAPPKITAAKHAVPKPAKIAMRPVEKEKVITDKVPDSIEEIPIEVDAVVPIKNESKQEIANTPVEEVVALDIEHEPSLGEAIEEIEQIENTDSFETIEELIDFVAEAEEVYQQIVELLDLESPVIIQEEESSAHEIASTPEVMAFEELIETLVKAEEPLELPTIIKMAEERKPLETTLAYLFAFFEQTTEIEEPNPEKVIVSKTETQVIEILSDIGIELQRISTTEKENTPLSITPELVRSLLELMRILGYEKPQEVLLMFLKRYSIEFLLYTLRSLYQAASEDNRQTQLLQKSLTDQSIDNEEPISVRLGKLIVAMFRVKSEPSDLVSID